MNRRQLTVLIVGLAVGALSALILCGSQPTLIAGGEPTLLLEDRRWDSQYVLPYVLVDEAVVGLLTMALIFLCRKEH